MVATYLGKDLYQYEKILYVTYAVVTACLFIWQLKYYKTLKLFAVYLLPIISFSICYLSVVIYHGDSIHPTSATAQAAYVFESLIDPLLIIALYELPLRMHEVEFVHFICLPYDEASIEIKKMGKLSMWVIRIIAAGLFIVSILVDFFIVRDSGTPHCNYGGFEYLSKHPNSVPCWLSLIPSIFLSIEAIVIGFAMQRFGTYHSIKVGHSKRWLLIIFGALCKVVSICFGYHVHTVVSVAGDIALLGAITLMTKFIVSELVTLGNFADFLRQSNIAFRQSHMIDEPSPDPEDEDESVASDSEVELTIVTSSLDNGSLAYSQVQLETNQAIDRT
jgi:hypothetical protein